MPRQVVLGVAEGEGTLRPAVLVSGTRRLRRYSGCRVGDDPDLRVSGSYHPYGAAVRPRYPSVAHGGTGSISERGKRQSS